MIKNSKITILFSSLILVGVIIFIANSKNNERLPYSQSAKGRYVAELGKDIYTLIIQSEDQGKVSGALAYNNYQKDSSSGSFNGTLKDNILLGNYSFDSEGMHSERQVIFKKVGENFIQGFGQVKMVAGKETFNNVNTITYDPKSTFQKNNECVVDFSDSNNTFTFKYNPFFEAFQTEKVPSREWMKNAGGSGILLANVFIPRTYLPGTNFSDAKLTVGVSTDPDQIKACTTASPNGETKNGSKTISGYPFTKFSFNDAAAGNYYETTSYRGIVDGDCYAIEYTIHSTNIGNYPVDSGVKEFDKSKVQNELEKVIESFKFLINSD